MKKYTIYYKEYGSSKYRTTTLIGNKSRDEVISFFGLEEPDIEDYKIEEEEI